MAEYFEPETIYYNSVCVCGLPYLVTAVLQQLCGLSGGHTVLDVLLQRHRVDVPQRHHFLQSQEQR